MNMHTHTHMRTHMCTRVTPLHASSSVPPAGLGGCWHADLLLLCHLPGLSDGAGELQQLQQQLLQVSVAPLLRSSRALLHAARFCCMHLPILVPGGGAPQASRGGLSGSGGAAADVVGPIAGCEGILLQDLLQASVPPCAPVLFQDG